MANGKIRFGKQSGGELALVIPDGVSNTEVVVPESGVLATEQYVDSKYSGFKNYIINGKKVVNQRGLTSTDNSYNQDRWYKVGNNWFQGIEGNGNLINGKTYTLSWVGSATAGYYVGTATSSTINAQTFTPIANGGSFTLTISTGQNLWIKFAGDATGSTFNYVQLEEGSVATPFENRPYGLEISLCQRYFVAINEAPGVEGSAAFSGATVTYSYCYPVIMRTLPTLSNCFWSNGYNATPGTLTVANKLIHAELRASATGDRFYAILRLGQINAEL